MAERGRRLIIASNRLPFNVKVEGGELSFQPSAGGLVSGLASYLHGTRQTMHLSGEYLWVGWPGTSIDDALKGQLVERARAEFCSYPVFLTEEQMERFYFGFCNATLWPLFHYFTSFTVYEADFWQQYKQINQSFCDALDQVLRPDDVVWVHDYHLLLLPRLLKVRRPNLSLGFFLHIPFPSYEVFRLLPGEWRREILEGMLGADLVGFHTYEYAHHFLQGVLRILGYEHHLGEILSSDHPVKVDTFPMGIDFEKFAAAAVDGEVQREQQQLKSTLADFKLVLSVDRLDYSKGISHRLEGFECFLESYPEYHGKVVLLMVVVPSRIGVRQYDRMKRQIEEMVGKINGRFGRVHWTPVVYQYRNVPFPSLVALYTASDICLVTPLRDGMNLVAKEYVATRTDGSGALVLSEMAGSVKELPEAFIINPNNRAEIAQALKEALETPLDEQKRRNRIMQNRLRRYNVNRWADDFLNGLVSARESHHRIEAALLSASDREEIVRRYRSAARRALFLDYDGTLTPLARYPSMARPDEKKLALLRRLAADPGNDVVVISGRDRQTLDGWFGAVPVGLVGEHGALAKGHDQSWQLVKPLANEWKQQLLPILEIYTDRLPGAFVEEKENSAAWHYRLADPEQAGILAAELIDHLNNLIAKTDLQVIQGNKVVEIRHAGVDKGSAAQQWLAKNKYDFIFAAGDDSTDEDLFRIMPASAVTIRIGIAGTHARYNLRYSSEVIALLESFVGERREQLS
ncbi:MAG TPA: bifunctional alpha,alpha-trehalose-phosphate synthase (UDP-forming)/trehalose-phosphatase [Terriglobales bacterium]|nr:bifunctional alpha,alpha-trehalose-phosphate synthase (UDP-forming)/trehalose-phosphatase [Terriglobales bacterium]